MIERLRLSIIAHGDVKQRDIVEAVRGVQMFRSECFFAEMQRPSGERNRLGILAGLEKFLSPLIELICLGKVGRRRPCSRAYPAYR